MNGKHDGSFKWMEVFQKINIDYMFPSVLSLSPHKTYNETGKILNDRLGQCLEGRNIRNEKGSIGKESAVG